MTFPNPLPGRLTAGLVCTAAGPGWPHAGAPEGLPWPVPAPLLALLSPLVWPQLFPVSAHWELLPRKLFPDVCVMGAVGAVGMVKARGTWWSFTHQNLLVLSPKREEQTLGPEKVGSGLGFV